MILIPLIRILGKLSGRNWISEKQGYNWGGWEVFATAILVYTNSVPFITDKMTVTGRMFLFTILMLMGIQNFHHVHLYERWERAKSDSERKTETEGGS